jgi:lipopolysaccharide/colanic/teichoic acid biosynthesis glycosyltransferase
MHPARFADEDARPARVDITLRALDIVVAGTPLLLLSPLILLVAVLIRLTSGSPVLYRGKRVGQFGRVYVMYKFRTLRADAEKRLGPYYGEELTRRTAAEVTRLGRLLRASQLDELPQLWNVLRGDMSVVGPRPLRPVLYEEVMRSVPRYWQRLVVRPGLTGLAQIRITREDTWEDKLAHDLEYIADRSIQLSLWIMFMTTLRIFRQSVAVFVVTPARRGR